MSAWSLVLYLSIIRYSFKFIQKSFCCLHNIHYFDINGFYHEPERNVQTQIQNVFYYLKYLHHNRK